MTSYRKRENFLPFCLPDLTEGEINEVVAALKSGWLAKGPRTIEFEEKFADYVGAKYAVAMNSCTAALHVALAAAGITSGDEVITTPMTFSASANTIIHTGAKPVFVDIDKKTGCIDPDAIEEKITKRTKAIVPVHYSGEASDLDKIYEVANKYGLFVSEDAAHALSTCYKGRIIGSHCQGAASFSFYATKNICTGEGGMLVTENEKIANQARVMVTHGMSKNAWNRYTQGGSWRYDIETPGFKYNMFDLQAALGLKQLERLETMQERRKSIVDLYNQRFSELDAVEIPSVSPTTTTHSQHLYIIRLKLDKLSIDRDLFMEELKDRNIGVSVHFIPVHLMSYYRNQFGYQEGDFPIAEAHFERIITLPLYSAMSDEDANDVIDAVYDIVEKFRK